MTRPSDHSQLDLACLNHDSAFGQSHGLILWQPRIQSWFTDREFVGEPLPEPYRGLKPVDVYRKLSCSNRVYKYNSCFTKTEPSSITHHEEPLDDWRTRQWIETPKGRIDAVFRSTPNSPSLIREKRWIETPEDMRIATWILDESGWGWDQGVFDEIQLEWGDLGAPNMYMPRVNVQHLYIDMMGVERAVYALLEWGKVVEDYFRALHQNQLRMIEVINSSPIDLVCFGDNLHCSTLSPALFEEYVLPAYLDRCDHLHRAGKFVFSHWDGDTRALLKYARVCGLDGIEAITPKPQGDVTLEQIHVALGDKVYFLDGIPALLFDPTYTEDELLACTEKVLSLFGPRLILGISDEMASTGIIERVSLVGKMVDDYNASLCSDPATIQYVQSIQRCSSNHP